MYTRTRTTTPPPVSGDRTYHVSNANERITTADLDVKLQDTAKIRVRAYLCASECRNVENANVRDCDAVD